MRLIGENEKIFRTPIDASGAGAFLLYDHAKKGNNLYGVASNAYNVGGNTTTNITDLGVAEREDMAQNTTYNSRMAGSLRRPHQGKKNNKVFKAQIGEAIDSK